MGWLLGLCLMAQGWCAVPVAGPHGRTGCERVYTLELGSYAQCWDGGAYWIGLHR